MNSTDLDTPLYETGLPFAVIRRLHFDTILTVGDLASLSRREVSRIPNFGKKSIVECQRVLDRYGLDWETGDRRYPTDDECKAYEAAMAAYERDLYVRSPTPANQRQERSRSTCSLWLVHDRDA